MKYLADTRIPLDLRTQAADLSLQITNELINCRVIEVQMFTDVENDSLHQDWQDAIAFQGELKATLNNIIHEMRIYIKD